MDAWFKEFGHRPHVRYYRLLHQHGEDRVDLEEFHFDTASARVVDTRLTTVEFKWWVDSLAANAIHPVPESQVPFLFHF